MLSCLREIAWITSTNEFLLKLEHMPAEHNVISNLLSRWYNGAESRRKFKRLTNNRWKRHSISPQMLTLVSKW